MKKLIVCAALWLLSSVAFADDPPKTAADFYKAGAQEYDLGNFEKAADLFKQGYQLESNPSKQPAYLYNMAQAYRQGNKCKEAAFAYKRFLSLKEDDKAKPLSADKKAETEQLAQQMEDCAKQQEKEAEDKAAQDEAARRAAEQQRLAAEAEQRAREAKQKRVASGENGEEGDEGEGGVTKQATGVPTLVTARLELGGAKVTAGGLDVPIQSSFAFVGGYPLALNEQLALDFGAVIGVTPVAYKNSITGDSQTGSLTSVLANAGASYKITPQISARGDLGVGLLAFGGIQAAGNPFTEAGAGTTGTLVMPAVRFAVSGDYLITPNLFATATPFAFQYSPAKEGLRMDIKSITQVDFLVGVGYRM